MDYTLHQLRVFYKVYETQSITKAAEELHLTQPAVSIQLKKLQDQFEIPLVEVIGRQLYITDFGKEIAEATEKILLESESIRHKTLAYKGQLFGKLKVLSVSTGKYVMPYFLTDFLNKNKGVELVMDVTNKSKVVESLEKNEVDFALVSILPEHLNTNQVELMENKLFLVGNEDFKSRNKKHNVSVLEKLPLIFRESGSGTRQTMERFINKNNLTVSKTMELTSNEAVKQAVLAGLGCSLMPLIGIKNELMNGDLHIIPVNGLPINTYWNLVWLQSKKLSPVAKAYIEFLNSEKENLIDTRFSWLKEFN